MCLQVVWPNGVLASTAVGLAARVLTARVDSEPACLFVYLGTDGKQGHDGTQRENGEALKQCICRHHPADETGDPLFDIRKHLQAESGPQ